MVNMLKQQHVKKIHVNVRNIRIYDTYNCRVIGYDYSIGQSSGRHIYARLKNPKKLMLEYLTQRQK